MVWGGVQEQSWDAQNQARQAASGRVLRRPRLQLPEANRILPRTEAKDGYVSLGCCPPLPSAQSTLRAARLPQIVSNLESWLPWGVGGGLQAGPEQDRRWERSKTPLFRGTISTGKRRGLPRAREEGEAEGGASGARRPLGGTGASSHCGGMGVRVGGLGGVRGPEGRGQGGGMRAGVPEGAGHILGAHLPCPCGRRGWNDRCTSRPHPSAPLQAWGRSIAAGRQRPAVQGAPPSRLRARRRRREKHTTGPRARAREVASPGAHPRLRRLPPN